MALIRPIPSLSNVHVICAFCSSRGADPGSGTTYGHYASYYDAENNTYGTKTGSSTTGFTVDNDYFTLVKSAVNNSSYTITAKADLTYYVGRTDTTATLTSGDSVTVDAYDINIITA